MNGKLFTNWLCILLTCFVFAPSVYAETNPNISVSDCIGKGMDCSSKNASIDKAENLTDTTTNPAEIEPTGLTTGDYIRTLLAFIFVIGLLLWLLRFMNNRNRKFDQNRLMTNLGGVPLGQHKSIQLVKMGNRYFVVGVGENVQLLREIDDPDEIADLLARYDQEGSEVRKGIIPQLYERFLSKNNLGSLSKETSDFNSIFTSKMEEIKADRKQQLDRLKEKGSDRDD
ncbi:flagellar biosynthetic protein FliO [Sporosarcina sp. GW1-11]|uniref:flagellar biosynthetic protein FliO n=1 Tax=Sporosarcina sp. GW1-11 TaxID=2899126 RepID=UPI00294D97D5|nr:flagellar biosynthetic protein FliO [Sporosarcina sp. GW1-11]MDV6376704.1 flagellar biosynthetic protein FliO [Sporosarcina sp. GW1-11]